MTAAAIAVGDVVQLKSGGPLSLVVDMTGEEATISWLGANKRPVETVLPLCTLVRRHKAAARRAAARAPVDLLAAAGGCFFLISCVLLALSGE